jgi:hypothetical protein
MKKPTKETNVHTYYEVAHRNVLDKHFFDTLKVGQETLQQQLKDQTAMSILRLFSAYKKLDDTITDVYFTY